MKLSIYKPHKFSPVILLASTVLAISFLTRLFILLFFHLQSSITFPNIVGSFFVGFMFDIVVGSFIILPFALQITFTNNFIYTAKGKKLTMAFFIVALFILLFTKILPKDFNADLYKALVYYVSLRCIIYVALAFLPTFKNKWRTGVLYAGFTLTIFLLFFNAVSEYFFWEEFSSRYNFIAVDYLVYTNEVAGNIKESYPLYTIITLILTCTIAVLFLVKNQIRNSVYVPLSFLKRSIVLFVLLLVTALSVLFINANWKNFSKNNYANELAGNGIFEFVKAFQNNELDFYKFYKTMPDKEAFTIVRNLLTLPNAKFTSNDLFNIEREITSANAEKKMNVVLISVESLSASFMQAFGSKKNITPQLDSLANHSLFFTNLYASGTRTVRGLEALSLSLPPSSGQSIVKRPNNEQLFSLGSVFEDKGYTTQYIYGGYGYFDNMSYFFGNNDYTVIDRAAIKESAVHYANIWGVADEDLFTLALNTMDSNYHLNKPFFSHVMTVSNHRPYTYPDGRIDIPSATQTRAGAVKYTDYAIGKFIKEASSKPWFNNTVFVIVADHCASSAGNSDLPVTGYHIPMLIYSPANIQPKNVDRLTAQIDIAPTILGLLNFNYKSKFFGQDVFNTPDKDQRAFISTYQGLGYLKDGELIVQSPLKKVKQYKPNFITGKAEESKANDSLQKQAIAFYQVAAWLVKHKKFTDDENNHDKDIPSFHSHQLALKTSLSQKLK